jgi:transcriptional antiterminator RfaH
MQGHWAELCQATEAKAVPPGPNPLAWYVIATKRHAEALARVRLAARGIESYLPLTLEWGGPASGGALQPLFPGYLLVHVALPGDFYQVTWAPGVKAFVAFGDTPPILDDDCVEFLRAREGPGGFIPCAPAEASDVRVVDGPLRGLSAVVERHVPARERVVVLLHLLQRQMRVELPGRWIKPA